MTTAGSSERRLAIFARLRRATLAARRLAERWHVLPLWTWPYERVRRPFYEWLRPRGLVRIEAQGLQWQLDSRDEVVTRTLITYGAWEPEESALILAQVRPGAVVVDIGANFGYHTLLAARAVGPSGHVFAFEPSPRNFTLLSTHLRLNAIGNVTAEPLAVADRPGTMTLFLSEGNFGAHSLAAGNVLSGEAGSTDIAVTTLDAYFASRPGVTIDLIKMDAQGAEGLIIAGARQTLLGSPRLVVIFEFWPLGLEALGTPPASLLTDLGALGFRLQYLDGAQVLDLPATDTAVTLARSRDYLTIIARRDGRATTPPPSASPR
jgi:FkbM family methyltransferase